MKSITTNVLHKRAGHTSEPVKILDTLSSTTNYTTNIEDIETNKLHYYLHTLTVCLLEPHLLHLSGTLLGALLSGQARKTGSIFSSSSFGCSSTTGL